VRHPSEKCFLRLRLSDSIRHSVRDAAGPRKGLEAHPAVNASSHLLSARNSGQRAAHERRLHARRIPFPSSRTTRPTRLTPLERPGEGTTAYRRRTKAGRGPIRSRPTVWVCKLAAAERACRIAA